MRFLSEAQIYQWHDRLKITLNERKSRFALLEDGWEVCAGPMCMETNRASVFTTCLCGGLGDWHECLLWISDWGVWPSSQHMPLYTRLRRSFGDEEHLHTAPGHLFKFEEKDDLISFVYLCVVFGWDFSLTTNTDQARIFGSHDEFVEAMFRSEEECVQFAETMASFFEDVQDA